MSYNFQSMEKSPVIVVVGHIDHGKSTLLDYIRKTKITESEAGGITQRISAYEIEHQQKKMTFIDTPGHEAFSAMREQGALAADLAILVVSAEEGVKPQTLEAKATIEKNQLPYIVAINKIDKPTANLETTKKSLAENGIYLEGRGGEVPVAAISAKTGQGVPELLDLILLATEMAALKKDRPAETAGADWLAEGFILEVQTSPQQGVTAVAIIRRGPAPRRLSRCGQRRLFPDQKIGRLARWRSGSFDRVQSGNDFRLENATGPRRPLVFGRDQGLAGGENQTG